MKKTIGPSEIKKIISSKNIEELTKNLKIEKDQDLFSLLLEDLDKILNSFETSNKSVTYKILGFLEEISYSQEANLMRKSNILSELKEKVVEEIKKVDKKTRKDNKRIIFFKDIVNRLENLELNITYNLKSPLILANYNIVKYVIFELKDINCSKELINKNPHLINAFDINSDNIIKLITQEYLKAIDEHAKNDKSYNLFYYDEILDEILKNSKIKKEQQSIENIIQKITYLDKNKNKNGREIQKANYWYKHLINKLDNENHIDDINSLNSMYDINYFYKKEVVEETEEKGETSKKLLRRIPKRYLNDYVITIDDENAYERDDAISITKLEPDLYQLKIIIADPSSVYDKESYVLKEARKRGETLYLDEAIGMFHENAIKSYLSLDENARRLVREYTFKITSAGIIEDFKITKRPIIINKNYTYEEINQYIQKAPDIKTEELLENLIELKGIINKKYINEEIVQKKIINMTKAEDLIETYMIFANNKLAEFASSRGIPFVYRHHKLNIDMKTNPINMKTIPENNQKEYRKIIKEIQKTNLSAKYSTNKKSHDGLNLEHYCHSTSPLRRYADILVNECIDNFYFKRLSDKELIIFEDYLKEEVEHLNDRVIGREKYLWELEKTKTRTRTK